ncbi:MAG: nucleotidyl transferase AbiEii/AbiGii toxin family protein [Anaerolineae bacterium]
MPPYADECLRAIVESGLSHVVSVGGAVGLMHYLEYRQTHDLDAWWATAATEAQRRAVIDSVAPVLRVHGEVAVRSWGDVVSVELLREGTVVFSFQVASRSALIEPPTIEPSTSAYVDSLADPIAAKMTALVERGAPRDFRDIYMVCSKGLAMPSRCWAYWRKRQELAGSDADMTRARTAIETHLTRIEMHRPLTGIATPEARAEANALRSWFREVFLNAQG